MSPKRADEIVSTQTIQNSYLVILLLTPTKSSYKIMQP